METISRTIFNEGWQNHFGKLQLPVVDSVNFLLDEFDKSDVFDTRAKIAYALATIKLETADTFVPVNEGYYLKNNRVSVLYNYYRENNPSALKTIFPNGKQGLNYLGRGFVQLTHDYNYQKLGDILNIDLISEPGLAINPDIAFKIMESGMTQGLFTGKKLSDYFNGESYDFVEARRIINGKDRAGLIAAYADKFFSIIKFS